MLTVLAVQNPTKCTNCEDSSQATARCLDCVENLCTNCVFAHKRIRQTKDHRILTFDEIQANEVKDIIRCPSFCSVHPREVLLSFLFSRWLESASLNVPVKSKLQHPPGIPRAFDAFSCPEVRKFDHRSCIGGGNLIASLDVKLRDKSWRRRRRRLTLMNSKEKIAYLWRIG